MWSKTLTAILVATCALAHAVSAQEDFAPDYQYPDKAKTDFFSFSKADDKRVAVSWADDKDRQQQFYIAYPEALTEAGIMAVLEPLAKDKAVPARVFADPRFVLRLSDALAKWDSVRPYIGLIHDADTDLWYSLEGDAKGSSPEPDSEVLVHMKGYAEGKPPFEDSEKRGKPMRFKLGEGKHLPAVEQAITLLKVGQQMTVRLPADRAFGGRGVGSLIPPGADIYYDIELLKIY
ncbi:MAG: FKBP-type peptidyl-prolyl cis-trans isomerase [Bacteroidota bacterium]